MIETKEGAVGGDMMVAEPAQIVRSAEALESLTRGEIDSQIATAKRFPRSVARFKAEIKDAVRESRETAASCYYTLSRSGKRIEGPSVRLAELAATSWGNARIGGRIIAESDTHVVAQGTAFDLERNVAFQTEVRRRITTHDGKRYPEDLITVTCNAAVAIATRNVTLKMIPRVYLREAYQTARAVAAGEAKDLDAGRKAMLAAFAKLGVTPEQVFRYCGKAGEAEITTEDLADLLGVKTAIDDGDTTAEDVFGKPERANGAKTDGKGKFGFAKTAKPPEDPGQSTSTTTNGNTTPPPPEVKADTPENPPVDTPKDNTRAPLGLEVVLEALTGSRITRAAAQKAVHDLGWTKALGDLTELELSEVIKLLKPKAAK